MTSNPFELYIDRLKNDDTEQIYVATSPESLDLGEKELTFLGNIVIAGQAYLANNHLILDLKIKAVAAIPCSICNGDAKATISIEDFSHTVEICEVRAAIYNFKDEVRSAILLRIPQFLECEEGHCPQRKEVNKFLNSEPKKNHSPFLNLEMGS